jgi:hypothetical protein
MDIRALIASDSYAASFQTMGQYRTALLRFLDRDFRIAESAVALLACAGNAEHWTAEEREGAKRLRDALTARGVP